jgi:hypothetical protein
MRKALLVFALVAFLATGTVFAELTGVGEPTVSGSVTTQYGYDFDSESHGFYNDSSLTLTLPLLDGSTTKGGDDGMYGEITVDGIGWQLNNDGFYDVDEDADAADTSALDASISAKLVINDLYVDLGAPDFDINNVDVSDDYIVDANFWTDDSPALMGVAVGFMNELVTVEARIANRNDGFKDDSDDDVELVDVYGTGFSNDLSDGGYDDFTGNTAGYILGAAVTLNPAEGITIPVVFSIDMTASQDSYFALGAAPSLTMGMLTVDLPIDYVSIDPMSGFEVGPSVSYCLTEAGGSNVALGFVYGSYSDVTVTYEYFNDLNDNGVNDNLGPGTGESVIINDTIENAVADLSVTFTETEEKGFVPNLAATVALGLVDMTDYLNAGTDMGWDVDADLSYNVDGLKPYVNFGYGSDEVLDLGVGAILSADFTGLDNTTVTLDYTNEALTESVNADPTENGRVTVDVTVAF